MQVGEQTLPYERIVATLPLNRLVEMSGQAHLVGPADPPTSVLVLNLGVMLPEGPAARHGYHWLYLPDSRSGMHRVGSYSNVDPVDLPPEMAGV